MSLQLKMSFYLSVPGENGLVIGGGNGAELQCVVCLNVQVLFPKRDLELPDALILADSVLVVHLEHKGLLSRVIGGKLKEPCITTFF